MSEGSILLTKVAEKKKKVTSPQRHQCTSVLTFCESCGPATANTFAQKHVQHIHVYTKPIDRCKKFQTVTKISNYFAMASPVMSNCTPVQGRKNLIHCFPLGATFKEKIHLQKRYQIDQSFRKKNNLQKN